MEKWLQWLSSYPGWNGEALYADRTVPQPGNAGVFSKGLEELSRKEDVLGNIAVRYRWTAELVRVTVRDFEAAAAWMTAFQSWVNKQSSPGFGDVPGMELVRAEKGMLSGATPGTLQYSVMLTAEFIKYYTEEEHGKN